LPPYGACLLGSINLAALVQSPFTDAAAIDMTELDALVRDAVRAMDNVVDVSRFPLPEQQREARTKRRIGLGVTGLADALILCRARYGSDASLTLIDTWMKAISRSAYLASADLAREKGTFPLFDRDAYLAGATVAAMDEDVRDAIAAHGIRNALLTSIAPTGTISLFAGNVSSGIEPVFAYSYTRKVLMPDGTRREERVTDYAVARFHELFGDDTELPDYFVNAQELTPADHLAVQAVCQRHIDSSISKTINVPEEISFEDFKSIYTDAFEQGLKGCTTYRPSDVRGSVLSVDAEPAPKTEAPARPIPFEKDGVVYMSKPLERETVLPGFTYKLQWPESDHAMYITINDIMQPEGQTVRRRPFEIFINSKNMEHYAWTVALTRMISAVFRRGGDVTFVVEELKAVFDPRGGSWMKSRYVPSLLAAIGEVIEQHMLDTGFITREDKRPISDSIRAVVGEPLPAANVTALRGCSRCGERTLIRQEGCETCTSCGYSKCG
jgi:ribonucleoside-diphosphate reductase alpha chain